VVDDWSLICFARKTFGPAAVGWHVWGSEGFLPPGGGGNVCVGGDWRRCALFGGRLVVVCSVRGEVAVGCVQLRVIGGRLCGGGNQL